MNNENELIGFTPEIEKEWISLQWGQHRERILKSWSDEVFFKKSQYLELGKVFDELQKEKANILFVSLNLKFQIRLFLSEDLKKQAKAGPFWQIKNNNLVPGPGHRAFFDKQNRIIKKDRKKRKEAFEILMEQFTVRGLDLAPLKNLVTQLLDGDLRIVKKRMQLAEAAAEIKEGSPKKSLNPLLIQLQAELVDYLYSLMDKKFVKTKAMQFVARLCNAVGIMKSASPKTIEDHYNKFQRLSDPFKSHLKSRK